MRNAITNASLALVGACFALLLVEVALRIYQPIDFRVKGDRIVLPCNQRYIISNATNRKLDSSIVHTKNSLGFRGEEKPQAFEEYISLVSVGGSTTECYYLSDGRDWMGLLGAKLKKRFGKVWVNNAGLDGHSTFGHRILLTDHLAGIRPDYVLYLVGCNDVAREDLSDFDRDKLQGQYVSVRNWLKNNSEVVGLFVNLARGLRSKRMQLTHSDLDLLHAKHAEVREDQVAEAIDRNRGYARGYAERLRRLVRTTKELGMTPILITQPLLVGEGIDDVTGVNLETLEQEGVGGGRLYWAILESYNDVTRSVGREEGVLVIDLARRLPKSSRLFYDMLHFTNEGSEEIGEFLFRELEPYIAAESAGKIRSASEATAIPPAAPPPRPEPMSNRGSLYWSPAQPAPG